GRVHKAADGRARGGRKGGLCAARRRQEPRSHRRCRGRRSFAAGRRQGRLAILEEV
ncbi:hypothetical protein MNEG_13939, partial [Monoraphidium neglectum]